jgi:cell division ATPase FtsA
MAVNRNLAVGVDAGSSRTRCVIGILDEGYLRLLGYGEAASVGGWVKGRLSDQTAVRDSILDAVQEAERKAGVTVDAAVAGIGGVAISKARTAVACTSSAGLERCRATT